MSVIKKAFPTYVVARLTFEALEVIDIAPCPHDHLEGWDLLIARGTVPGGTEHSVGCRGEGEGKRTREMRRL